MAENISPEERLFKVIQQGKSRAPGAGESEGKKPGGWLRGVKRFLSPIVPAFSENKKGFDWKKLVPKNIKLHELDPGTINRILVGILAVIAALVVYSSAGKRQDTTRITEAVSKIQIASITGRDKIEPLKEESFYLDQIRNRDIFHLPPKEKEIERKPEPERNVSDSLKKATQNMKLQGISWGGVPKAMIFWQSDKESKMYFLREGQSIGATGIKVKEVHRNKVVIGDDEEEMELL
ncbi:MAG: hypothetical protein KKE81_03585 [Candidatus Omnitrophica bacterium]|nr:hypothetical protein [Candidatus Omnitrophota bacterium]